MAEAAGIGTARHQKGFRSLGPQGSFQGDATAWRHPELHGALCGDMGQQHGYSAPWPRLLQRYPDGQGASQGAPESPFFFIMIIDMVISTLEPSWRRTGYDFFLDQFRRTAVCYADDIVLAASSKEHLEAMISDVVKGLREIGFGVGAEKSHWTSNPCLEGETLSVDAGAVEWEGTLTFVGTVLDLTGSAGPAIQHRMAQANKAYSTWKEVLACPWIPKALPVKLLPSFAWSSLLWSSSAWATTKAQRHKL